MSPFSARYCYWLESGCVRGGAGDITGSCVQAEFLYFLLRAPREKNHYCWRQTLPLRGSMIPIKFCCSRGYCKGCASALRCSGARDARDDALCAVLPCFTEAARLRRRLKWHMHGWFCSGHCTSRCSPGVSCQARKARHHHGFDQCRM